MLQLMGESVKVLGEAAANPAGAVTECHSGKDSPTALKLLVGEKNVFL